MIVNECPELRDQVGFSEHCYGPNMPADLLKCDVNMLAAWAVGGAEQVFPPHVGLQFGGENAEDKVVILQMHYDNPTRMTGVTDNSGMRIYYTDDLRQYDL